MHRERPVLIQRYAPDQGSTYGATVTTGKMGVLVGQGVSEDDLPGAVGAGVGVWVPVGCGPKGDGVRVSLVAGAAVRVSALGVKVTVSVMMGVGVTFPPPV